MTGTDRIRWPVIKELNNGRREGEIRRRDGRYEELKERAKNNLK